MSHVPTMICFPFRDPKQRGHSVLDQNLENSEQKVNVSCLANYHRHLFCTRQTTNVGPKTVISTEANLLFNEYIHHLNALDVLVSTN